MCRAGEARVFHMAQHEGEAPADDGPCPTGTAKARVGGKGSARSATEAHDGEEGGTAQGVRRGWRGPSSKRDVVKRWWDVV